MRCGPFSFLFAFQPKLQGYRALFHQAALGLQVLHEHNVVHGDLKPGNMLLVENSGAEWARACGGLQLMLGDFGMARHLDAKTYVQTKGLAGTLAFAPPEAFQCLMAASIDAGQVESSISVHSDRFSFGTNFIALHESLYALVIMVG